MTGLLSPSALLAPSTLLVPSGIPGDEQPQGPSVLFASTLAARPLLRTTLSARVAR